MFKSASSKPKRTKERSWLYSSFFISCYQLSLLLAILHKPFSGTETAYCSHTRRCLFTHMRSLMRIHHTCNELDGKQNVSEKCSPVFCLQIIELFNKEPAIKLLKYQRN